MKKVILIVGLILWFAVVSAQPWGTGGSGSGTVDTGGTPEANDFAKFSDSNTLTGRSYSETRTDLGLVIGTNVQAYDADLTTWAGITPSANGGSLVSAADYAAMKGLLDLEIGTDVQAYDAFLADIAALTDPNADRIAFWDDSAGDIVWLTVGAGLSITDTTITTTGSATALNDIGDAAADGTIAQTGYKQTFTSTLDSAGAVWTMINTDVDLTADVSFIDFKYTDDGDANGYFIRGYDNATDLKWYIGANGDALFNSLTITPSANPAMGLSDSDAPGTDKESASFYSQYVDGADTAENHDFFLAAKQDGTLAVVLQFDESDDQIEFKKNVDLETYNLKTTGTIKGRMEIGANITGSTAHDTTELHNTFNPFTAAATITLDAAADAGFGSVATYWIRDAGEAAVIDPQAGEKLNLDGTALAAGVAITATGAGKSVTIIAVTDTDGSGTDGYICIGNNGWASE